MSASQHGLQFIILTPSSYTSIIVGILVAACFCTCYNYFLSRVTTSFECLTYIYACSWVKDKWGTPTLAFCFEKPPNSFPFHIRNLFKRFLWNSYKILGKFLTFYCGFLISIKLIRCLRRFTTHSWRQDVTFWLALLMWASYPIRMMNKTL